MERKSKHKCLRKDEVQILYCSNWSAKKNKTASLYRKNTVSEEEHCCYHIFMKVSHTHSSLLQIHVLQSSLEGHRKVVAVRDAVKSCAKIALFPNLRSWVMLTLLSWNFTKEPDSDQQRGRPKRTDKFECLRFHFFLQNMWW